MPFRGRQGAVVDSRDRAALTQRVWDSRYRHRAADGRREADLAETQARVAAAVASVEGGAAEAWRTRFLGLLEDFRFLPGGRILAGAGTGRRVTLCNCFVMGAIDDSLDGIFSALGESALTLQQGGGIGCDFSTLRPAGRMAAATGRTATGPVSFMRLWDRMCEVLVTGSRRGALMGVLHAAHPDIAAFVRAKTAAGAFSHFNFSVLVADALLRAVRNGDDWALRFPCADGPVVRTLPAAALWEMLLRAAYESGEPGVVFIDRVNRENNLRYGGETLHAVNPCGELPLPPYGACVLGSLNLVAYVRAAFSPSAHFDHAALARDAALAVRFLDNALDLSHYPLPQQRVQARATRRIGLGITGLADALVMLGLDYASEAARGSAENAMAAIADAACLASIDLAREKGGFPRLDPARHAEAPFFGRRAPDVVAGIRRDGIRNSHLLAIAPAGSISLLAGNVSSGLEPVFARDYERLLRDSDGQPVTVRLAPYSLMTWREQAHAEDSPPALVTADDIVAVDQLRMQAVLQRHVDNAISKTVTVPAETDFAAFRDIYLAADALGLKGCAAYRSGTRGDAVMHCVRNATVTPFTSRKG